jgi:mono/diheme cytochrome c family protein
MLCLIGCDEAQFVGPIHYREHERASKELAGSDLRLLAPVKALSDVPKKGKNLILLVSVDGVLRFRAFDAEGKMVVDQDEKSLADKSGQIHELKTNLQKLSPPQVLEGDEKDQVLFAVSAIVGQPQLAEKARIRQAITQTLARLYGDDVRHIKVPENSGLRDNGLYLASYVQNGEKLEPVVEKDPSTGKAVPIAGGYAVYRRNCLHCHGVSGGGDGPTGEFLYPRPRDFRMGIFKFTSTEAVDAKPTRSDLRKTILYGLHGTSMPGFEANLSEFEIDQVIDYVIFLSMRGETERYLIEAAVQGDITYDEKNPKATISEDLLENIFGKVASSWKDADSQVVNPSVKRVDATRESIQRGRELYLNLNTTGNKVECLTCHGPSGKGNGSAFIDPEIFRDVTLRYPPRTLDQAIDELYRAQKFQQSATHSESKTEAQADPESLVKFLTDNPSVLTHLRQKRDLLKEIPDSEFAEKFKDEPKTIADEARKLLPDLDDPEFRVFLVAKMDLWTKSLDVWGNPLRPANLIEGVYKGGRRPIDLYWRISKGINGVKMPAHSGLLTGEQIWDVVNFVLALPEEPGLLPESLPKPAPTAPRPSKVASSR